MFVRRVINRDENIVYSQNVFNQKITHKGEKLAMLIENMKDIKSIVYWTDINGSLTGNSVRMHRSESSLPPQVAAVYKVLNLNSGFYERVATMDGRCGLLLDILYDEDWVTETASEACPNVSSKTAMDVFGATLHYLAKAMYSDIRKLLDKAEDTARCADLKMLVGVNSDWDGHELSIFVPFEDGAAENSSVLIECARAARIVECYLNHAAYNERVKKLIRDLAVAVSIDTVDSYNFTGTTNFCKKSHQKQ